MKYFLLFLLPLIALGEGPVALPAAGPKMGPEIEFRGKKLVPSMLCQVGDHAGLFMLAGGVGGTAYVAATDENGSFLSALAPAAIGAASGAFTFLGCGLVSYKDAAVADSYLRKIYGNLQPRIAAGELKATWSSPSSWRSLDLEFPDGRKISFSKDPNVVEVKISPLRPGELAEGLEFYQKEIFDAAHAVGLKVPRFDGPWNGGHIHIDILEAFDSDPAKLRNFLLDFIDHPELADGVLVKDFFNAPALDPAKQGAAIQSVMKMLEDWEKNGEKLTHRNLLKLVSLGPFSKRDSLNINTNFGTLEVRSLRSQKSAAELLKVMRLIEARIKYTNSLPTKEFHPKPIKMSREEKRQAFRAYVEGAGLDYEEFKDLAPRRFQDGCAGFFSRMVGF